MEDSCPHCGSTKFVLISTTCASIVDEVPYKKPGKQLWAVCTYCRYQANIDKWRLWTQVREIEQCQSI